jgi:tetratricopeptide (TPR) repeat protein
MSLSKPLNLLAKIYMDRRIYARAEHYLDQARAIAENDLDHDELCKIFLNFAALYRVQNLHERTAKSLQRAFESVKKSNDLRTQARVLYNLGITSAILSDPAKGQHFLSEAIEVAINLGWGDFIGLVNDQIRKL